MNVRMPENLGLCVALGSSVGRIGGTLASPDVIP